jgi:hypothetical protein
MTLATFPPGFATSIFAFLLGSLVMKFAQSRGRKPLNWILGSFLLGVAGMILIGSALNSRLPILDPPDTEGILRRSLDPKFDLHEEEKALNAKITEYKRRAEQVQQVKKVNERIMGIGLPMGPLLGLLLLRILPKGRPAAPVPPEPAAKVWKRWIRLGVLLTIMSVLWILFCRSRM